MGQRGPAPKSHALRVLEGSDKYMTQGRLGDLTPAAIPAPPEWLSDSEVEVWEQEVRQLSKVPGLLACVDQQSIARYCADVVEYVKCRGVIESEGDYVTSQKGGKYQHPAIGVRNKCHERMMRYEAKFGKTPADRARLEVGGQIGGAKDELEDLLA